MRIQSQVASQSTRQSVCLLLENWFQHNCLVQVCWLWVSYLQSEPNQCQSLSCCRRCPKTTAYLYLKSNEAQHRRRRSGSQTLASLRVISCSLLRVESSSSGATNTRRSLLSPVLSDSQKFLRRRCSKRVASSSDWVESSWAPDARASRKSHLKSNSGFPDLASLSHPKVYEAN